MLRDPRRLVLACLGIVCTALGAVGAFVPGLPTTVFVIIAAWCFAKSCPWLEQRLLRVPLFAPAMAIIDGTRPYTSRMRVISLVCMWLSGGLGVALLFRADHVSRVWPITVLAAMLVGTAAILRYKRIPAR
ncbi:MAG: YbaN family protein [Phycisphaerales bacterium]